MAKKWFTAAELADQLGVSVRTIRRWHLPSRRRAGRYVLFHIGEAQRELDRRAMADRNLFQHPIPLAGGRSIPLAGRRPIPLAGTFRIPLAGGGRRRG